MRSYHLFLALILVLVSADIALGATLHGSIYDIELNELSGVVVEVDSTPPQRYVSKDGTYSFELNPGEYTITANYTPSKYRTYTSTEQITVAEEGDYVFDIFLFPDFDEDLEELFDDDELVDVSDPIDTNGGMSGLTVAIIAVAVILVLLIVYYVFGMLKHKAQKEEIEDVEVLEKQAEKERKEAAPPAKKQKRSQKEAHTHHGIDDEDLKKVIDVIRSEGGRTTQKELRKQIPLSEAKISLMVSELEHKKIVQKVKKGRGNIIILKKK